MQTASAPPIVKPPLNTASRLKRVCSSAVSSSWLHANVAASARWRAGRSRSPLMSSSSESSNRSSIAAGLSTRTLAAASSIASGSPSSRSQILLIAVRSVSPKPRLGMVSRARAMKSSTAGPGRLPFPTDSGGTGYSCSP